MKTKLCYAFVSLLAVSFLSSCGEDDPEVIHVSSISISETTKSVLIGDEFSLEATISPSDADNKNVTWSIASEQYISLKNSSGLKATFKALKAGETTITVKTEDGGYSASCNVSITDQAVPVSGVILDKNVLNMEVDESNSIKATIIPETATNKNIIWSASPENIVSLSPAGSSVNFTALKAGEVSITATTVDGGYSASCAISIKNKTIKVSGIELDNDEFNIEVDDVKEISATVSPLNATNKKVEWSVDNDDVISLSSTSGSSIEFTALKAGNAIITATTVDGGFKDTCSVTVKDKIVPVSGLLLDKDSVTISEEESFSIKATIVPSNATNKNVSWSISNNKVSLSATKGEEITVNAISEGTSTITAISEDGHIEASCNVTITKKGSPVVIVPVTGVALDKDSVTMEIVDEDSIKATITPTNATNKDVNWSVDHNDVVSLTASGSSVAITALKDGNATITVTTDDGGFTATCDVTVNKPVAPKVRAYIHDEKSLFVSIEEQIDGEFVTVTDKGSEEGVDYYNVIDGALIRVTLKDEGYFIATGLEINGLDTIDVDENKQVVFTADTGDLEYLSLTPIYDDETPGDYTLDIKNTTHLTVKAYKDDKFAKEITAANQGDKIYLVVTADDEDYFCSEMSCKRITSDIGSPIIEEIKYDESLGCFVLTVPYAYDKKITIIPTERNNALLRDTDIPGTYLTVWLTTATKSIDFNDKIIVVDDSGYMASYYGDNVVRSDYITSYTDSTFYTESYHTIPYGKNYIFTNDRNSGAFYDPSFENFDILCVKKVNATDSNNSYTIDGERFKLDDKTYAIMVIYHNDVEYFSFFVDYSNKKIYNDISIKMIYGEKFTDNKAMYTVSDGVNDLIAVSYTGDGGVNNRIPLISPYGVYSGDNGDLLIANDVNSYYDGVDFVYSIEENTVTLTNADRTVVINIDKDNFTYEVVSDKEDKKEIPDLKNKVFAAEVDGTNATITFNNYTSASDIKATMLWGAGSWICYDLIFDVTYDLNTNIITLVLVDQPTYPGWQTLGTTFTAQMMTGKLIPLNNLPYGVNIKNVEFTCDDFVIGG